MLLSLRVLAITVTILTSLKRVTLLTCALSGNIVDAGRIYDSFIAAMVAVQSGEHADQHAYSGTPIGAGTEKIFRQGHRS